jgi:hypothetical protein
VSFAAITLCVASQRVFIVVRVNYDPRFSVVSEMSDLKEQCICVKFCFELGKTASETHEVHKTALGGNAMGRTQTSDGSLDSNVGKLWSKIQVVPQQVPQTKTWRMFAKSSTKTDENSITEIAGRLDLSYGTCQRILRTLTCGGSPAHTALSVQRFLAAKNMAVVPHAPYSPDLAPCDFFLFPRMKSKLKGCRFQDVTEQIVDRRPTRDFKKSVPAVLPAVAETLDPLHKLGRGIQ